MLGNRSGSSQNECHASATPVFDCAAQCGKPVDQFLPKKGCSALDSAEVLWLFHDGDRQTKNANGDSAQTAGQTANAELFQLDVVRWSLLRVRVSNVQMLPGHALAWQGDYGTWSG